MAILAIYPGTSRTGIALLKNRADDRYRPIYVEVLKPENVREALSTIFESGVVSVMLIEKPV
jgi:hypothetical protein